MGYYFEIIHGTENIVQEFPLDFNSLIYGMDVFFFWLRLKLVPTVCSRGESELEVKLEHHDQPKARMSLPLWVVTHVDGSIEAEGLRQI